MDGAGQARKSKRFEIARRRAVEPPPPGWQRYVMKSKFGAGRDFAVTDLNDAQVAFVDGKLGPRPKAEVKDGEGNVRFSVSGRLFGVPKQMTISDHDGREVASLKAKMFSPIKSRATLTMADGSSWQVEGSLLEKDYSIAANGRPVVQISQKWVTIRDTYTLDVAEGVELPLALAIVWASDRWTDRD
jgi:uncharacterized protein YxjI